MSKYLLVSVMLLIRFAVSVICVMVNIAVNLTHQGGNSPCERLWKGLGRLFRLPTAALHNGFIAFYALHKPLH